MWETALGSREVAARGGLFCMLAYSKNEGVGMVKNILLSIITIVVIAAGGTFIYQTISTNNEKQARAAALEQVRKECSSRINPRAEGDLVYGEYNQCLAGKGFDEFKK